MSVSYEIVYRIICVQIIQYSNYRLLPFFDILEMVQDSAVATMDH